MPLLNVLSSFSSHAPTLELECAAASWLPTPFTGKVNILHHPERLEMPNFNVLLEGAWLVRDVKTEDDAIGVAISEAGKRLNQRKMDFVEVEMGQWDCPECGEPLAGVFLVASTALVALLFEIKIFNAESEEHAGRIAKSTIGKALGAIPLRVLETTQMD
jgi:hypothetical protein